MKLTMIRGAARDSTALVEGIAFQSQEQASAIELVSAAIRTLDEMIQHNAALVEETTAAIEQTEGQATELDRIVDIFTIVDGTAQRAERSVYGLPMPGNRIGGQQSRAKRAARSYLSQG